MKFEILKENISRELSKAEKMTGKNLSLPVLSAVFLEADKNSLCIRATNLDLGIEIRLPAVVSKEGKVAVSARVILSFLNNVKDGEKLKFELKEGVLNISSSFSNVSIKTLPTDEFPLLPKVEAETTIKVKASDFSSGLKSVVYSSSTSSMKPELSSVYVFKENNGDVVFVATDSFRLAEKKVSIKGIPNDIKILTPFKNASEIIKICDEISSDIEISINKNQLSIVSNDLYMVSRVIEGVFPDYRQILPKSFVTEAEVLKQDILNALKIINVFSDKFNQVNFSLDTGKNELKITSKNTDIGETENTIPSTWKGEAVKMNFNYRYIIDCFQSIPSDSVKLCFSGQGRPLVIKGVSDESFLYLVMPMNK